MVSATGVLRVAIGQIGNCSVASCCDKAVYSTADSIAGDKFVQLISVREHSYAKSLLSKLFHQIQQDSAIRSCSSSWISLDDHEFSLNLRYGRMRVLIHDDSLLAGAELKGLRSLLTEM